MSNTINREFSELWLRTIEEKYEVHQLFNDWWQDAPDEVKDAYVADFLAQPEADAWIEGGYYAEPLDLDELARLPEDSVGHAYRHWIVQNNLEPQISMNYRKFHEFLESSGKLAGMPEQMKYAVLRGFQTHDFQHVITGISSDGLSEIRLQAFCLAQLRFPYFAMWISVVTGRMTYLKPQAIVPLMDAITAGWQMGREIRNIQFERWEERLEEPLAEVRREFLIAPEGLQKLAA